MVATNLKEEAMKLMDHRSLLEAEMNSIIDRLSQPGGPGLSGNLWSGSKLRCEIGYLSRKIIMERARWSGSKLRCEIGYLSRKIIMERARVIDV
ncbi:hypothetical protein LguiB_024386 [Lonicera macranthoides]